MIAIVATLVILLLSGTSQTAGQGSHAVGLLQDTTRSLERLLQHTLEKVVGP
jgi:hypothetical protein